jgi:uncharacterized protein YndB with AHSA1/START domain
LIEVELTDQGEHTTVVLINRGVPEQDKEDHRVGWQSSFDNLEAALRS